MTEDTELLHRYAEEGSAEAFAELVQRNLDLVYAAALRHVGDAHRAQDIAQGVFVDLARKAGSLRHHPSLVSWLYTSTRFAALKVIRSERRRLAREQEAFTMQQLFVNDAAPEWDRLRPILDDAMHELGARDREIVLLRYFRGLAFADVARALRINEGAARMRSDRALDKLAALLARRGITSTASALGIALVAQPGAAAPAGLAASIAAAALTGAVGGSSVGVLGTFLAMSKLKLAVAAVLVGTGLTTAVLEVRAHRALTADLHALDSADLGSLQRDNQQLRAEVTAVATRDPAVAELRQLQERIATLQARPAGLIDTDLHLPQNLGRATPAAAIETLCWAIEQRDLDLVASFITFSDDTPANRDAFMAQFSDAVRARYRTPERLCAAAFFGAAVVDNPDPKNRLAGMHVVSIDEDHGPEVVKIKLWFRAASGLELPGNDTFKLRDDGWAMKPIAILKPTILDAVRQRLDPATGAFVPPKASGGTPAR
jgi:RNA polymerase sigma factor (sigma-70 family)